MVFEYETMGFVNIALAGLCMLLACALGRLAGRRQGVAEWLFASAASFAAVFLCAGILRYKFGMPSAALCGIAAVSAALVILLLARDRRERGREMMPGGAAAALILIVAASALLRALLMWHSEYPLGDDARFHCLFAASISRAGAIVSTMQPFDPLPLAYPWGLDVMLAAARDFAGVPPHAAFKFLLIFYSAASVAGVYVIARRVAATEAAALWSAAMYGLAANYGSIDYIRWGGLPNALVMVLLMGILAAALRSAEEEKFSVAFAAPLVAAMFIIHGVAALVGLAIMIAVAFVQMHRGGKFASAGVSMCMAALAGIIAVAALAPDIFAQLGSMGRTAGQYPERYMSVFDFPMIFNVLFSAAAALGFAVMIKKGKGAGPAILYAWTAVLLYGFIASRYGFGLLSYVKTGEAVPAFLPSRLITDLSYPLAIFAGAGMAFVFRGIASFDNKNIRMATACAALIALAQIPFQHAADKWQQVAVSQDAVAAMDWMAENTAEDAVVINDRRAPAALWVPYRTGRVTTLAPRPVLYHLDAGNAADAAGVVAAKENFNRLLEFGDGKGLRDSIAKSRLGDVYVYTDQELEMSGAELQFKTDSIVIYKMKRDD